MLVSRFSEVPVHAPWLLPLVKHNLSVCTPLPRHRCLRPRVQVSASRLESYILNALVQNSRQLVSQPPACSSTSWKLLTDTENDTGLKSRICFKLLNPKLLNPKPSNKPLRPEIRLSSQLLGICPFFTMGACGGFATSPPGSWGSCAIVRF